MDIYTGAFLALFQKLDDNIITVILSLLMRGCFELICIV